MVFCVAALEDEYSGQGKGWRNADGGGSVSNGFSVALANMGSQGVLYRDLGGVCVCVS